MRLVWKILAVFVAAYLAFCAFLFWAMGEPERISRVMEKMPIPAVFIVFPFQTMWSVAQAGNLDIGDSAPDFTLTTTDKKSTVQLSSFRGQKPVVLVFGSYT